MTQIRTYSELSKLSTYRDRYLYLKLNGAVADETFGFDRYLNQALYRSPEWKRIRDQVILRDNGCDLGIEGREIYDKIIIHHMNPITIVDIQNRNPAVFDPEYLISVTHATHNAIHYGDESLLFMELIDRQPNDTRLW